MAWRVALHMLSGMAQVRLRFPRAPVHERRRRVQAWAREMLARLGVELSIAGAPAGGGPMLLVANHISWLDIVALHAVCHCRFVSKADVRRWPVISTLAGGGETLYVERRSRRDAMRVVHRMAEALRAGDVLAIFPEGTTGDGRSLLPFHGNLLQAAISAGAPVQPVALRFLAEDGAPSRAVSYQGNESLLGSIWRTLREPGLRAVVAFAGPQASGSRDRRSWARDLRLEIAAMLSSGSPPRAALARPSPSGPAARAPRHPRQT